MRLFGKLAGGLVWLVATSCGKDPQSPKSASPGADGPTATATGSQSATSSSGQTGSNGSGGNASAAGSGQGTQSAGGNLSSTDSGGAVGGMGGAGAVTATFPLRTSSDNKYLMDAAGEPFLMVGDTAWSLIAQLSKQGAEEYLDARGARGVNTVVVNLLEHKFTSHSPAWANSEGVTPFGDNSDFSTVNAAYFDHAAWVVEQAAERGILVLLTPMYIGYDCADEGWCPDMKANGVDRLTQYGRFLGERFGEYPNIIWVHGGDHNATTNGNPSEMDLVNAIREGVAATDRSDRLHTAHWDRGTSSSELGGVNWLDLDAIYSGDRLLTYQDALDDWDRSAGVRPTFLFEGLYESEHGMARAELRAQMFQPMLAGATGFVLGNNPMWYFGDPSDGNPGWGFSSGDPMTWREALDSPGIRDVQRAATFFRSSSWTELRPDVSHQILTKDYVAGDPNINAVLAATQDASVAVAYFTGPLSPTFDLSFFESDVDAEWVDPTTNAATSVDGSPFTAGSTQVLTPPSANASNAEDWLLVLRAR